MSVYIEHRRAARAPQVRRYSDLRDAAQGISQSSHYNAAAILADLRSRGRFHLGGDCWEVVTVAAMTKRAVWALQAVERMEADGDVPDPPG